MNNLQRNCVAAAHHIQLSFSENNELIVCSCSHDTILMHKIIIPIENMHYLYVTQSNNEVETGGIAAAHFNLQLRFYSEESNLEKQHNWIELTGVVDGKHIYTIKSNMVFITNIDEISLHKKQKYQKETDITCAARRRGRCGAAPRWRCCAPSAPGERRNEKLNATFISPVSSAPATAHQKALSCSTAGPS